MTGEVTLLILLLKTGKMGRGELMSERSGFGIWVDGGGSGRGSEWLSKGKEMVRFIAGWNAGEQRAQ